MKKAAFSLVLFVFCLYSLPLLAATRNYEEEIVRIKRLIVQNKFAEAEATLNRLSLTYRKNIEVHSLLASVLFWQHKFDEAITVYRRLIRLAPHGGFSREMRRVMDSRDIGRAGELLDQDNTHEFKQLLLPLLKRDETLYDAGMMLVPVYMSEGDYEDASALIDKLIARYPGDRDIGMMRAAMLFELTEYDLALGIYESLAGAGMAEARPEIGKIRIRKRLADADWAFDDARDDEAMLGFQSLFDDGVERCDTGYKLGVIMSRQGKTDETIARLEQLRAECDQDDDINILLGAMYFRAGRFSDALETYRMAGESAPADEVSRARAAYQLGEAARLLQAGSADQAQAILLKLIGSGQGAYEAGHMLGKLYFGNKHYAQAAGVFERMRQLYPDDVDFATMLLESMIMDGQPGGAHEVFYTLPSQVRDSIWRDREDIPYRATVNYIKLSGGYFTYTNTSPERTASAEASIRIKKNTVIVKASRVSRFNLTDLQATVDVYAGLGERQPLWGYITFSSCPDAQFLPETSYGGEIYRGIGNFEVSAGYTRMNFSGTSVDIYKPGITYYSPLLFSVTEKLYYLPRSDSFAFDTLLEYTPDHRLNLFAGGSAGQATEKITSLGDIRRLNTSSQRAGVEYRFVRRWSLGAEVNSEYRESVYQRRGVTLYTKLWW